MRTKQPILLVVAPYSKWFGVAVFSKLHLLDFAVRKYNDRKFDMDGSNCHATELINEFRPTKVVVKALTIRQIGAKKQMNILDGLKRSAALMQIPIMEFDLDGAKQTLLKDRTATLEALFEKVGKSFPELSRIALFQNRSQREYYTPLLSAVAIGASIRTPRRSGHERQSTNTDCCASIKIQ